MKTYSADNERIKRRYFAYLKEAMRQSEQSLDAVAKSIARFEEHTNMICMVGLITDKVK